MPETGMASGYDVRYLRSNEYQEQCAEYKRASGQDAGPLADILEINRAIGAE